MEDTEKEATYQKMASLKFDKPFRVIILFEENDEGIEVHKTMETSLQSESDKNCNTGIVQLPTAANSLSLAEKTYMSNSSSARIPLQKEACNHNIRPYVERSFINSTNYTYPPYQPCSQTDVHHREPRPNMYHRSSCYFEKQTNTLSGLTLLKDVPKYQASAEINSTIGLDIVSKNLLNIISLNHYYKKNGLTQCYEYQQNINQYFWLSYPVVNDKFLPREHDTTFIQNFLYHTLSVCYNKLLISMSYAQLAGIFNDMLRWAKEYNKRAAKNDLSSTNYHVNKHKSMSRSILSNSNNVFQDLESCRPKDKNSTCLFRLDTPELTSPLTINVDNEILKNHLPQIKKSPRKRENNFYKIDACPTPPKRNQKLLPYIPYHSEQFPVTSSPSATLLRPPHKKNENLQNYTLLQTETETFRSSISRDSGIASPHGNFGDNNQLNEKPPPDRGQLEKITPSITHVTSYNQNVRYINPGLCRVCGETTNKMCNGCYKYYYCKPQCQLADWLTHWYHCTR